MEPPTLSWNSHSKATCGLYDALPYPGRPRHPPAILPDGRFTRLRYIAACQGQSCPKRSQRPSSRSSIHPRNLPRPNSTPEYSMERQIPQEFILEAFADPASVRDVVRGKTRARIFSSPLNAPHLTISSDPSRWGDARRLRLYPNPPISRSHSARPSNLLDTGILHTIFFHRFFPSLAPRSREVLDITLPFVEDAELDTMIEKRAAELARELDAERTHSHSSSSNVSFQHHLSQPRGGGAAAAAGSNGGRGNISVQFFEKKRRKTTWYMRTAYDEEVCWESWTVKVTVAEPRTESGKDLISFLIQALSSRHRIRIKYR